MTTRVSKRNTIEEIVDNDTIFKLVFHTNNYELRVVQIHPLLTDSSKFYIDLPLFFSFKNICRAAYKAGMGRKKFKIECKLLKKQPKKLAAKLITNDDPYYYDEWSFKILELDFKELKKKNKSLEKSIEVFHKKEKILNDQIKHLKDKIKQIEYTETTEGETNNDKKK